MTRARGVAAAVLSLAFAACSPQEVVVADLPPAPDGGGGAPPCVTDGDCPSNAFCARARCGDVGGRCESVPLLCGPERAPTCGCNGVTYWNDCLRRAGLVTASTPGECSSGVACGGHDKLPCPVAGTSGARLVARDRCGPGDDRGTCWMLPPTCGADPGPTFASCPSPPPAPPGSFTCVSACEAIRSEKPFRALAPGASCP
jgi:hypothetical protein